MRHKCHSLKVKIHLWEYVVIQIHWHRWYAPKLYVHWKNPRIIRVISLCTMGKHAFKTQILSVYSLGEYHHMINKIEINKKNINKNEKMHKS